MVRTCASCAYSYRPYDRDPCSACISTEGGYSRWEPASGTSYPPSTVDTQMTPDALYGPSTGTTEPIAASTLPDDAQAVMIYNGEVPVFLQ